ncbi:MAG: AraC family transcriptional regulator [Pseudomonadales bacterium]|nr:MAG: AraC family transcriptional regulator [Pseudomonadales bacterium]
MEGQAGADDAVQGNIDLELQQLKKEVLALNRDLFILKEELMFPAHTQIAVFLSMDVGKFFELDSVSLKLDDKPVASHLYTPKQNNALVRGGVQRLYLGNVKHGEHELVAVFTGRGPQGRDYRRATSMSFEKNDDATHLEVKIIDSEKLMQPEFSIKHWN